MERESMLFVTNRLPYLLGIINYFPNSFFDFCCYEVLFSIDIRKNEA